MIDAIYTNGSKIKHHAWLVCVCWCMCVMSVYTHIETERIRYGKREREDTC